MEKVPKLAVVEFDRTPKAAKSANIFLKAMKTTN